MGLLCLLRNHRLRSLSAEILRAMFLKIAADRDSAISGGKPRTATAHLRRRRTGTPGNSPRRVFWVDEATKQDEIDTVVRWLNFAANALRGMKAKAGQGNQLTRLGNSVTIRHADNESASAAKYHMLSRLVLRTGAGTRKAMGAGGRRAQ